MPQIKLQDDEVEMIEELSPLKGEKASTTVKLRLILEEAVSRQRHRIETEKRYVERENGPDVAQIDKDSP